MTSYRKILLKAAITAGIRCAACGRAIGANDAVADAFAVNAQIASGRKPPKFATHATCDTGITGTPIGRPRPQTLDDIERRMK